MATGKNKVKSILIVEDDAAINDVVCSFLAKAGYACTPAFSGTEARLLLQGSSRFDMVITDLMLPGMSGKDVVSLVRASGDVPIIVVSAKSEVSDKVDLLRIGADDYLVKPFDLEELLARVEVQARRNAQRSDSGSVPGRLLRFASWELDLDARTLRVAGESIKLTRTEFEMVAALMAHPMRVYSKRDLSMAAWGDEAALEEKSVSTHIGNIRTKLKGTGTDGCIETVWGVGFRLVDDARR
ncbi:response regulator transcription factor [Raoultibacter phocaeensis]|uniref:response regulator transcription factor n=1 Tax=Raoultibacter phocaeensis TaxID=2479841 RepID=UPI00111B8E20|nr:response regulator transcription factor [Raoultibacter phocaeensis]